ncbi:MAG TPA: SPFH domain-containing protein [Streptosporangiaceae bacterium]|nr:SPFH domain-containing protein [Streptosporangiaceae bacterium]
MNAHWPRYRIAAKAVRVSTWSPVRAGDGKPGAPCAGDRTAGDVRLQVITEYEQGIVSRWDNVTLRADAVVYYRVIGPVKAVIDVQDYALAVSQAAQTAWRSVIGQGDMDQLLSERERSMRSSRRSSTSPLKGPGVSGWSG